MSNATSWPFLVQDLQGCPVELLSVPHNSTFVPACGKGIKRRVRVDFTADDKLGKSMIHSFILKNVIVKIYIGNSINYCK